MLDTDDEIVLQRQNRAGSEDLWATRNPPAPNRRARDRPTRRCLAPHEPAVHRVMQRTARQGAAGLQQQRLFEHKVAFVGGDRTGVFVGLAAAPVRFSVIFFHCAARTPLCAWPETVWPLVTSIAWSRSSRISQISSISNRETNQLGRLTGVDGKGGKLLRLRFRHSGSLIGSSHAAGVKGRSGCGPHLKSKTARIL